jgi:hypothetical protein
VLSEIPISRQTHALYKFIDNLFLTKLIVLKVQCPPPVGYRRFNVLKDKGEFGHKASNVPLESVPNGPTLGSVSSKYPFLEILALP